MPSLQAGDLRNKVGFYQRLAIDDGHGNTEGKYPSAANFTTRAKIAPKLGGESVLADRLTGRNLVNVTVRQYALTRTVTEAWALKDEHSGVAYNIRSIIDPDEGTSNHGNWFDMLCEKGVAVGEFVQPGELDFSDPNQSGLIPGLNT